MANSNLHGWELYMEAEDDSDHSVMHLLQFGLHITTLSIVALWEDAFFENILARQHAMTLFGPPLQWQTWQWARQQARVSNPQETPQIQIYRSSSPVFRQPNWFQLQMDQHLVTLKFDVSSRRRQVEDVWLAIFCPMKKGPLVVPSGSLVARVFDHVLPIVKRLFLCTLNIVSYGFGNTCGQGPRLSIRPTGSNVFCLCQRCDTCPNLLKKCFVLRILGSYLKHVQTCDDVRVQSATQSTASVHTSNMSKPVMTFFFKVLCNRLIRYILETCPNLWWRSFQSAMQSTDSVHSWNMSKPVMTLVFKVLCNRLLRYILETCPNLWWCSCSKCYPIDCFGT